MNNTLETRSAFNFNDEQERIKNAENVLPSLRAQLRAAPVSYTHLGRHHGSLEKTR